MLYESFVIFVILIKGVLIFLCVDFQCINQDKNFIFRFQSGVQNLDCCRKRLSFLHSKYNTSPLNLVKINVLILSHIMSFLDLMDVINLGQTCTHMKSIAKLSYNRFSHLSFGDSSLDESKLQTILQEIGCQIKTIEIFRLNKKVLDCLSEHCVNVTQMKLIDSSNIFNSISFTNYKPFFQNITSLEIRKGAIFFSTLSRVKRFQNFDKLLTALVEVNTLESLKIEYIEISPESFDLLKSIKSLKCLHLIRYQKTATLLPFLPNFEHLNEILLSTEDSKSNQIVSQMIVTSEERMD